MPPSALGYWLGLLVRSISESLATIGQSPVVIAYWAIGVAVLAVYRWHRQGQAAMKMTVRTAVETAVFAIVLWMPFFGYHVAVGVHRDLATAIERAVEAERVAEDATTKATAAATRSVDLQQALDIVTAERDALRTRATASKFDAEKLSLALGYAYEWEYKGATQEDPIRRIDAKTPLRKRSSQRKARLDLGVFNDNAVVVTGIRLDARFVGVNDDRFKIVNKGSWVDFLTDKHYVAFFSLIDNGRHDIPGAPLEIMFPPGRREYIVECEIKPLGLPPVKRTFKIRVDQ